MIKFLIIIYVLLSTSVMAESVPILKFESGAKQNTLIELFTSEGCSSCPPAERYLNSLLNSDKLWKQWFPVAFHVDYWDYIGWKDKFAAKEYGQRQSHYASLTRSTTVYTPAFRVNGKSWRRGLFSSTLPMSNRVVGNLSVTVKNNKLQANYKPVISNTSLLELNIAILAMDLTSNIKRGENAGNTAKHEFVVVGFNAAKSKNLHWKMTLPKLHYAKAKKYAIAIWVSEKNNPTPLQVVGGLLPKYVKYQ